MDLLAEERLTTARAKADAYQSLALLLSQTSSQEKPAKKSLPAMFTKAGANPSESQN